ncbi:hypothetical protein ACFYZJ_21185 [Streptomyces sp. NPDC001848]|uniref:hypothetical protein n=1 Tax=Streptomyces sp. NPDC001848 TaxID=3364618 RepID=UPI0036A8CC01
MGSDGLRADPSVLKAEGFNMFTVGQDFSKAVEALKAGLSALEGGEGATPPWGDDDIGQNFGVAYEGLREGMYESMGSLAQRLAGMGLAFTEMGVRHERNEGDEDAAWRQITAEYDGQVDTSKLQRLSPRQGA